MKTAAASPYPDDGEPWDPHREAAHYAAVVSRAFAEVEAQYAKIGKAELFAALEPSIRGRMTDEQAEQIEARFALNRRGRQIAVYRVRSRMRYTVQRLVEEAGNG